MSAISKVYEQISVKNGFKDTGVIVLCNLGTTVNMTIASKISVKTVSNVYQSLLKERHNFTQQTWDKIEQSRIGASHNFFFKLFDIMTGTTSVYFNSHTIAKIIDSAEAQAAARAFHDTDHK